MVKSKIGNPKQIHDIQYNRYSVVASMFNIISYDVGQVYQNELLELEFKSGIQVNKSRPWWHFGFVVLLVARRSSLRRNIE